MYTANTVAVPAVVDYIFRTICVYILVLLCTTNNNTSGGGRATESERYICAQQYSSSTCSSIYIFFGIQDIYQQSSTSTKFMFSLRLVRTFSVGERSTAGERRHTSKKVIPVKQGKRKTPEGILVLDIGISKSDSNRKMASVFNHVKLCLGQSLVSELSLRGCVKTLEPND